MLRLGLGSVWALPDRSRLTRSLSWRPNCWRCFGLCRGRADLGAGWGFAEAGGRAGDGVGVCLRGHLGPVFGAVVVGMSAYVVFLFLADGGKRNELVKSFHG